MAKNYTLNLDNADVFQILDALNTRADSYEQTAQFLSGGSNTEDFIIVEDCRDIEEAQEIARHFRDIVRKIEAQM